MDTLEALFTRRSCRTYTHEPVAPEALRTIIKAGMYAPSAGNQQPWHFVVVDDRTLLERIRLAHPYAEMLSTAPLAVLVCADTRLEKFAGFYTLDCSAAVQNMLLAAHAQGLAGVWVGIYPRQDRMDAATEILSLPEDIRPFALVALGHPVQPGHDAGRFLPERIHKNRFGQPG